MNIKDNKGVTGVDIAVAIVVIIVFVSIISAMFYNVSTSSKNVSRKAEATHIAVDVIEKMKQAEFGELQETGGERESLTEDLISTLSDYTIPSGYNVEISVEDYKEGNAVKIITTYVTYKVNKKDEEVKIQTLKKSDDNVTEITKEYTTFEVPGSISLNSSTATVQITGGDFKFEVFDTDSNSQSTGEEFTNDSSGNITFKINLTGTGDHIFRIQQIEGTKTGMIYDTTVYTVNLITKKDSSGKLVVDEIKAWIGATGTPQSDGEYVENIAFTNVYRRATDVVSP